MRLVDRILAAFPAAALAVVCTMVLGAQPAHASRPQTQAAKPAASRPAAQPVRAVRPSAGRPVAARPVAARPTPALARSGQALKPQAGMARPTSKSGNIKSAKLRVASASAAQSWGGISCVPFARAATGMVVKGNAHAWWASAAGTYERGQRPEASSILNFRSTTRMPLGHVSVVARVIDSRTVEVDHANWAGPGGSKGQVARGVPVIDVSEANDWSAVQVGLDGGGFGSVYPTYGFIYDRPDRGIMVANTLARPRGTPATDVAEAWTTRSITVPAATIAAPQRNLR